MAEKAQKVRGIVMKSMGESLGYYNTHIYLDKYNENKLKILIFDINRKCKLDP